MKKLFLFTIILFQGNFLFSQSLTLKYIDNQIQTSNPNCKITKENQLYIIEGIACGRKEFGDKLNAFEVNNPFFYLKILNSDSVRISCMRPNLIIVLIGNTHELKLQEKREILDNAKSRFRDMYNYSSHHILSNSKDPVLFVDDKKIHHAESKRIINKLSANKIKHLIILNQVPLSLYGTNAVNGLIRIWTKKYYAETYL